MTITSTGRGRMRLAERHQLVDHWRRSQGGVASRDQLRSVGIDRFDIRNEVAAGRWRTAGRHSVVIGELAPLGRWWIAIFETAGGAVLDGPTALVAHGMTGFSARTIDVSVAADSRPGRRPAPGVVVHRPLNRGAVTTTADGLRTVEPALAALRAAQWAVSDKQAALLLCLATQQRIADPGRISALWKPVQRSPRRGHLDAVITAVRDGAQALSELDFADACRRRGLPEPARQSIRQLPGRVAYLDAEFGPYGFAVEIDGSHHLEAARAADDMLRQNDVVIGGTDVLRIPVIGFHLRQDEFMAQVERMLRSRGWQP